MINKNPLMILLLLASFASVCAVIYTPALPDIANFLKITEAKAQTSLSFFLIGYAFGNLPWGPIANRFGRKSTTIAGLGLAIIGILITLIIKIYPQAWLLNFGRFVTAVGASVGIKIAFTYINDLYKKEETPGKIAYLMLSFAIAPGLAVASGGLLTKFFGWDSCFYASLIYGILAIIFTLHLPETLQKDHLVTLNMRNILTGYIVKLKNKTLVKASLIMGCGTTFIYLFASVAPFIGINELKLTPEKYGFYNFIPPIGMILGFYLTQLLETRLCCLTQIKWGIIITTGFTALFTTCFSLGFINPVTLFLPIPGIYIGLSLVFANSSSLAITSANNKSNASAMTNFLNMSLCVTCLFIVEALPYKASILLPLFYTLISICMIALFLRLKNDPKIRDLFY